MGKFENIKIGDKAELRHIITQHDIDRFVELTGDDNKLHVDKVYAGKTSFMKPVAHGMLGASFISTIIGTKIPGDGALWFSQNLEFLLPVRVGDELVVKAEVIKKIEQIKAIELQTDIFNQHKQKVTGGTAKVKIIEQEISQDQNIPELQTPRNALIIGGTGGIGNAVCRQLAREGCNIAIHYFNNKAGAESIVNELTPLPITCCIVSGKMDTLEAAQEMINEATRKIGEVNILVNCSGLKIPNIKFDKVEWSDIQDHLDLNVKSNFYIVQALLPAMKAKREGKFIFLTSQVTENVPPAEWSFYTIAKYALNGFAKSLAVEMAPFNIKSNLVSPGMTETALVADVPERTKLLISAKAPLRRLARPEDIANVIAFLVSRGSDYITGETIRVNGGQVMI